jgi:hypothetical protein
MIFGKKTTPLDVLEAEHATLTHRRERLAGKTQAARQELQQATEEQIKLLIGADDDNPKIENSAQRRVDGAASALKALEAALTKIDEQVSDAQRRIDELRQSLEASGAADEIDQLVLTFEKTIEPALTALRAFSKAAGELNHLNYETAAISQYAHVSASELEISSSLTVVEIRSMSASVRAGQGRIQRRPPDPIPLPPPPVVEKVWTIEPIAWAQDGRTEIRDLNEQVNLSPSLARRAIGLGAAVAIGDPRFGKQVASWRKYHGFGAPSLEKCVKLDDDAETAAADEQARPEEQRVLHSRVDPNFEIVDRGPAYNLKTHGPSGEAA